MKFYSAIIVEKAFLCIYRFIWASIWNLKSPTFLWYGLFFFKPKDNFTGVWEEKNDRDSKLEL